MWCLAHSGVTNQLLEHNKTGDAAFTPCLPEGKGLLQDALANLATSLKSLNAGYADLGLPLDVARCLCGPAHWPGLANTSTPRTMCWPAATLSRKDVLLAARGSAGIDC